MSDQITLIIVLLFISATLCVLMTLVWHSFDRPAHARLWALAFGLACGQWAINLAYHLDGRRTLWLALIVSLCSMLVSTLWLEGFRRRAGRAPAWRAIGAGWVAMAILIALCGLRPAALATATAAAMIVRAGLLARCAALVVPRQREATAAERGTIVFLILFAGFSLGVAALALIRTAAGPESAWEIARIALYFGMPTAFTGLGLFAVFLIASDLCEQMRGLAAADPLTGLLNRRGFDEAAVRALAHARRHAQPIAIAVADIDRFKPINDRFGHAAGDRAIRHFAAHVRDCVRIDDLVGRSGGDEFAMLLLGTDGRGAADVIERLRARLAQAADADPTRLTASFGISEVAPGEAVDAALRRADEALYRSKQDGRDRVTVAVVPAAVRAVPARAA